MALDTNGNPAVDFAWGNFPMQPNEQRNTVLSEDLSVFNAGDYNGNQVHWFYNANLPSVVKAGASVKVSGFTNSALNVTSTVKEVIPGPGEWGIVLNTPFVAQESQPISSATLAFDLSGNVGGGAGDYGWSKTTKKKSLHLDPALDGHAILDLGWNGYPGYTPGVSQPPFEPFSFSPFNGGNWSLQSARYNMVAPSFYDGNGFLFSIDDAPTVFGSAWADIQTRINNNKIVGAQLTYSGVQTMYGDLPGAGQKFDIIAAWYDNYGPYGNTNLYLKTAPAEVNGIDMPPYSSTDGYLNSYVTFTVTGGAKSGVEIAKITDTNGLNVDYAPNWMTYENAWMIPTALLTTAESSLLLDPTTVGKFMATSHILSDPMHQDAWFTKKWCDQIINVAPYTDSYGVDSIKVFFNAQSENPGWLDLTMAGERLVILN